MSTRIAFVADVHAWNFKRLSGGHSAGLNRRCTNVVETLDRAGQVADHMGCDAFVVLGDLFDGTRPIPQIISAVGRVLQGRNTIVVPGNHDLESTDLGDHALGPLGQMPGIRVLEKPEVIRIGRAGLALVPYTPGDARAWLPAAIEQLAPQLATMPLRVLGFHAGISDANTPIYLKDAHDALPVEQIDEVCTSAGIHAAVAGNWHRGLLWPSENHSPVICQVGTLAPTGFDDAGFPGMGLMGVWSDESPFELSLVTIPGPRFITTLEIDEDAVRAELQERQPEDRIYLRFKVDEPSFIDAQRLGAALKERGEIEEYVVEPLGTGAASREAAMAVQSVESTGAKISIYIDKVCKGDIDRTKRVQTMVEGFLASAEEC